MSDLPWFRFHTKAIDDERLLLLAKEDRWDFVALLCCKGKGLLDLDEPQEMVRRKVAIKLGVTAVELEQIERRLVEVGLVEKGSLQPISWDSCQFRSDTSTGRVRDHRERVKRSMEQGGNVSGTGPETDSDSDDGGKPPSAGKRNFHEYTQDFEDAWALYPARSGANPKPGAFKAWKARLKQGVTAMEMADGVRRYQSFCRATQKIGTQYVMMASTFFGPDHNFAEPWTVPMRPVAGDRNAHRDGWGNNRGETHDAAAFAS